MINDNDGQESAKRKYLIEAKKLCETSLGIHSPVYVEVCWALGLSFEEAGDIVSAFETYQSALIQSIGLYSLKNEMVKEWYEEMGKMSACESGLGETSGEGVFGLQRGFKLAGANSLLMSLWKVDDNATQMLMTNFYKNLMSDQSKQQSLQNAQKTVREFSGMIGEKYYDFSNPKYWAAFILLDALN